MLSILPDGDFQMATPPIILDPLVSAVTETVTVSSALTSVLLTEILRVRRLPAALACVRCMLSVKGVRKAEKAGVVTIVNKKAAIKAQVDSLRIQGILQSLLTVL
jgi:hypothetical protein